MRSFVVFSLVVASTNLFAATDPQSIPMGGGKLIPTLKIEQSFDDNIFSQANSEESDSITKLKPSVQWLQEKDTTNLALTYTGDYGVYWDSDDDDYDDHTVSFDAKFSPSDMVAIDFGASVGQLHDNRGEGSSEGSIALTRPEADEYDINNVDVELDFGRDSAMFGVWVKASRTDIEYQNNRSNTAYRDRDETYVAARLYGKVSGGKTRFFVEASNEDFSYDNDPLLGGSIDSEEKGVAVGIEWEITGKTTGSVKIGEVDKEFDVAAKGDDTVNIWDVDLTWSPRSYSHVMFSASKSPNETNGTGNFIESQDVSISWIHSWSDRLNSTVSIGQGDDDYLSSARDDDRDSVSIGFNYDWKRWVSVGAAYSMLERDSNDSTYDYDKNVFTVTFDLSL